MAVVVPTIGSTGWGPILNAAITGVEARVSTIEGLVLPGPAPSGDATGATDRAAINAVLATAAAAGGGRVMLQPGTYWVDQMISLKTAVGLTCPTWGSTIIKQANGKNLYAVVGNYVSADGVESNGELITLEKLIIDGNKANNPGASIVSISGTTVTLSAAVTIPPNATVEIIGSSTTANNGRYTTGNSWTLASTTVTLTTSLTTQGASGTLSGGHGVSLMDFPNDLGINTQLKGKHILRDVWIRDTRGDGFRANNRSETRLDNVHTRNSDGYGFIPSFDTFAVNCSSGNTGLAGWWLRQSNVMLSSCKAWYAGQRDSAKGHGFYITYNMVTLAACISQDNTADGFALDGATDCVIQGIADSNSRAGAGTYEGVSLAGTACYRNTIDVACVERRDDGVNSYQTRALKIRNGSSNNKIRITHAGINGATVTTPYTLAVVGDGNDVVINGSGGYLPVTYATPYTPDLVSGTTLGFTTLTGDLTINNPSPANWHPGQRLTFILPTDATARTVTFGNKYLLADGGTTWTSTANQTLTITFTYDGTNWREVDGSDALTSALSSALDSLSTASNATDDDLLARIDAINARLDSLTTATGNDPIVVLGTPPFTGNNVTASTTNSQSITLPSGGTSWLILCFQANTTANVTAATLNGVTVSQLGTYSDSSTSDGTGRRVSAWKIDTTDTGVARTLTFTFSLSVNSTVVAIPIKSAPGTVPSYSTVGKDGGTAGNAAGIVCPSDFPVYIGGAAIRTGALPAKFLSDTSIVDPAISGGVNGTTNNFAWAAALSKDPNFSITWTNNGNNPSVAGADKFAAIAVGIGPQAAAAPSGGAAIDTTTPSGGWVLALDEDFTTASVPIGGFTNVSNSSSPLSAPSWIKNNFSAYPNTYPMTNSQGVYDPATTMSVDPTGTGILTIKQYYDPARGKYVGGCLIHPIPSAISGTSGYENGMRFRVRVRARQGTGTFYTVVMAYPDDKGPANLNQGRSDYYGEIDAAEGKLNGAINVYNHEPPGVAGNKTSNTNTGVRWADGLWHVVEMEWLPSTSVKFWLDGKKVLEQLDGSKVPPTAASGVHLLIQCEIPPTASASALNKADVSYTDVDRILVYKR